MKIQRASSVRPCNPGSGGRGLRRSKIQASDLPAIAKALGLEVDQVIETGKRLQQAADQPGEWEGAQS